jgi:hypothetical protein
MRAATAPARGRALTLDEACRIENVTARRRQYQY